MGRDHVWEFGACHPRARVGLNNWIKSMENHSFANFHELRNVFGSADYVRPYTVFNIGGNRYRLIATVHYDHGRVAVEGILTHSDYDRFRWRR
ncbi:MAG: type II toxin-antitoxin system HigB family toxin [Elusimicrobia bacterium]|nr:type II toxin-antitoxin system HigB family toxin [Elusimicrobiota bacterium]